ncbi:MAG: hypothetical protein AAF368_10005, partial [Planctomycetota bacterium]
MSAFTDKGTDTFFAAGAGGSFWEIDASDAGYSQTGPMGFVAEGLARGRNDYCGNATEIGVGTFEGSLVFAGSVGDASCGSSTSSPDVWYRFRAESAGNLRVTTCGTHDLPGVDLGVDTVLSLHPSCPGEASNEIVCNDDANGLECTGVDAGQGRDSALQHAMVAGEEVLIRVSNFNNGPTGPFLLHVDFDLMNDTCAAATPIGVGTTTGTLAGATLTATSTCDGSGSGTVDSWYSYTPSASGTLNVTTCGTFDMNGVGSGMD